jgi:hypothetical protein
MGTEVPAEVGVSLDSETDQHDEVFDPAQYLVDACRSVRTPRLVGSRPTQPTMGTSRRLLE